MVKAKLLHGSRSENLMQLAVLLYSSRFFGGTFYKFFKNQRQEQINLALIPKKVLNVSLTFRCPFDSCLAAADRAALMRELMLSVVTVTTLRCLAGSWERTSDLRRRSIRDSSSNSFNSPRLDEPE